MGDSEYILHVGALPGRKSMSLSVQCGSVVWPVAYFRNYEMYKLFKCAVDDGARLVWDEAKVQY